MASEKILLQKQQAVAELKAKLEKAVAGVMVDYKGIDVANDTQMRKELREAGIEYFVVKNTMLRFAAENAHLEEMKDVLESVRVLTPEGKERRIPAEELELGYRTSAVQKNGYVVLGAVFSLKPAPREEIRARMDELAAARREKQPLEYPSGGSTFKRPEGHFAGKLIQDAGLKGFRIGDAQVSEKHCGFVINRGQALAADVMAVCRCVSDTVYRQTGIRLEMELKTLGDFPEERP